MSDPRMGADPIGATRSMLNPGDLAAMKQEGGMRPGMTVRDFLGKVGIDVDGPVEQLTKFGQSQVQNASGLGRMRNIAGMTGQPGGMPRPGAGAPPPEQPGMEGLLRSMK